MKVSFQTTAMEEEKQLWQYEVGENESSLNASSVIPTTAFSIFTTELSLTIYGVLMIICVVFVLARSVLFFLFCMRSSIQLHNTMFENILRSKMRFFDTNPSGRILNRFSKDMGSVDELLPRALIDTIQILLVMIGILVMILIVNYIMIVPMVIVGIVFFAMRVVYISSARSVKRLEGITRSPVFSHLSASMNGLPTIRSSHAQQMVRKEFDHHQSKLLHTPCNNMDDKKKDCHTSAWYLFICSSTAFGLWLDAFSNLFVAVVTFTFLLIPEGTDTGGLERCCCLPTDLDTVNSTPSSSEILEAASTRSISTWSATMWGVVNSFFFQELVYRCCNRSGVESRNLHKTHKLLSTFQFLFVEEVQADEQSFPDISAVSSPRMLKFYQLRIREELNKGTLEHLVPVLVWLSSWLGCNKNIDGPSGTFGAGVGLALSQALILTGMVQYGVRQSTEVVSQVTSVERVLEYTNIEKEPALESESSKKPPSNWPNQGCVKFDDLSLRYDESEAPVLTNLNFTIESMHKVWYLNSNALVLLVMVGIVGRTGAGKSSLISALFRLARLDGTIVIDSVDIQTLGLHDLRQRISIIPQEPVLFSATLRHNLDPFQEFNDDLLWNVLEEVELKESVESLDFQVNEGGSNFSVGQRQLICLARAILRNNKILVLDEATANVDPQTDALIQGTIRRKFADCTVLTIAHRLNTIMDSDKVLVMDAGTMMEFDHPHLLLQDPDGHFYKMVRETGSPTAEQLHQVARLAFLSGNHEEATHL
uniref:Uncharacterized protein n=1 Tax=Timema tahoe TaxID=61484 RepID=A0A7R9IRJ9_9NEOP|nr:unnamed protein product [Timema tahoe]